MGDIRDITAPRIRSVVWGELVVDGLGTLKDAKLWPGGGRGWDWNETGTRHQPGIQPADVAELLEHGARVVVLSQGMEEKLGIAPETLADLAARGVEVHVAPTLEAVGTYNRLAADTAVGGLFHSTC